MNLVYSFTIYLSTVRASIMVLALSKTLFMTGPPLSSFVKSAPEIGKKWPTF